jgi:uncharacterized membrane protein
MSTSNHRRYPELDLLRTVAILGMVTYHAAYDLASFYGWQIDVFGGGWWWLERAIASLFLLLVGISFAVSAHRTPYTPYAKYLRRGLTLLAWGMAVSLATYLWMPQTYVRFGVLHLIGTSVLLLPLVAGLRERAILLGIFFLLLHAPLLHLRAASEWLLPIGIMPAHFATVDYFPLVPWFGVVLIGYGLGYFAYVRMRAWRTRLPTHNLPQALTWPGRHSLFLYLIHQPVILGILWLAMGR